MKRKADSNGSSVDSNTNTASLAVNKNGEISTDDKLKTSSDYYFDSYSHFGIHEEMLKDECRTNAYRRAIEENSHMFVGKTVLDIGCGTGVLSMFAAIAGAAKVYAIECSGIVVQCREIIKDNSFDNIIEVIQGKVEEITLPVDKVDIIISEWMGYFLLYESMLDTVLFARDKWLDVKNGGVILPDKANLYVCTIEDSDYKREKIDFWDNVYGFNMSSIKRLAMLEPLVDCVPSNSINSNTESILTLDLLTCTLEDLAFDVSCELLMRRDDYVHALVAFFDVEFSQIHRPLTLSTSPYDKYTHWKQTVFYLPKTLTVCKGEKLNVRFKVSPNSNNKRDLDIYLSHEFNGEHSQSQTEDQLFRLR